MKKIRLQKIVKNTILGYKKTEFDSFFVIGRLFQVPKKGKFHRKNKRKRPALRESVGKKENLLDRRLKICYHEHRNFREADYEKKTGGRKKEFRPARPAFVPGSHGAVRRTGLCRVSARLRHRLLCLFRAFSHCPALFSLFCAERPVTPPKNPPCLCRVRQRQGGFYKCDKTSYLAAKAKLPLTA